MAVVGEILDSFALCTDDVMVIARIFELIVRLAARKIYTFHDARRSERFDSAIERYEIGAGPHTNVPVAPVLPPESLLRYRFVGMVGVALTLFPFS